MAMLVLLELFGGIAGRVGGMPVVIAGVAELARRALPRLLEQVRLVKALAYRVGRAGHDDQMGVADLLRLDSLDGLGQRCHPLSHRDAVANGVAGEMAVDTNPVVRSRGSGVVPVVGLDELGGEP